MSSRRKRALGKILMLSVGASSSLNRDLNAFCSVSEKLLDGLEFQFFIKRFVKDLDTTLKGFYDFYVKDDKSTNLYKLFIDFDSKYGDNHFNFNTSFLRFNKKICDIKDIMEDIDYEFTNQKEALGKIFSLVALNKRYLKGL